MANDGQHRPQIKRSYQELLADDHVALLSAQQQLLYASNRHAMLLNFLAMTGKDGAIRHVDAYAFIDFIDGHILSGKTAGCPISCVQPTLYFEAPACLSISRQAQCNGARWLVRNQSRPL
jgi:hypothetical protein